MMHGIVQAVHWACPALKTDDYCVRRPLGSARTELSARSTEGGRHRGRLETRPVVVRAQGHGPDHGTDCRRGPRVLLDHSEYRHHHPGRRQKFDAAERLEIAESVPSGRKSAADMARLYGVNQPTVSRIVATHPSGQAQRAVLDKSAGAPRIVHQ
jgi:hypothetical protein